MTNFIKARINGNRGSNQKDPQPPRQTKVQQQAIEDQWAAAGFTWTPGSWRYTWPGEFPVFIVSPDIITDNTGTHAGLVARCATADKEILFPYGTRPADIAAQLDDEILEIIQLQADIDAPLIMGGGEIVGEEIPF